MSDLTEHPPLRGSLRGLLPYLEPHRGRIAVAVAVTLTGAAALAVLPAVLGAAVDAATGGDLSGLYATAVAAILLAAAHGLLAGAGESLLGRAGERVVHTLRDLVAERLATAPLRFVERHRSGDLITRATTEAAGLASVVRGQVPAVLSTGGFLLFSAVVLAYRSWELTLLLAVVLAPPTWLLTRSFNRAAGEAFAAEAVALNTVAATFAEGLEARETFQAAGAEDVWQHRYERAGRDLYASIRRTVAALGRLPWTSAVEAVSLAVLLVAGGWMVARDLTTAGTLVVFVIATRTLFDSLGNATRLAGELQDSRVLVARLLDLIRVTTPGPPPPRLPAPLPERGVLAASGIGFTYAGGVPVLREVTEEFPAGDRAALVGRTGAGKTTLAKVLTGLYEPDAGVVTYAGLDLRAVPPEDLRRRIALVVQRPYLLPGTLLDNLALAGARPSAERAEAVIAEMGLSGWLRDLGGLEADLGVRGDRLSAGEHQLVGFIRAALLDPAVLILDEATSDVDERTAALLETAIDRLHAGRTLIVIAHRPAGPELRRRVVRPTDGAPEK